MAPAPAGNQYWTDRDISGRPKAVSPEIMADYFVKYVKDVKDNPVEVQDFVGKDATEVHRKKERPLTMEGFENYVAENGGPITLAHYFSNRAGSYEDFIPICDFIKRKIRADQIQGGMAGIYNASITQRLNGLAEKVDTTTKVTADPIDYSLLSDEALREIANATNKSIER